MATRSEKATETKKRIIDGAVDLIREQGPEALTSGKLAKHLGISKGTLFHHFEDMNSIKLGLLETIFGEMDRNIRRADHKDLWALISSMIDATFGAIEKYRNVHDALLYFVSSSARDDDIRQRFKRHGEQMFREWRDVIFSHAQCEMKDDEKERFVRIIDMYFAGLCVHQLIFDDLEYYKMITEDFMEIMASYLEREKSHRLLTS